LFQTVQDQSIENEPLKANEITRELKKICTHTGLQEGNAIVFIPDTFRRGHAQYRFSHPKNPWSIVKLKKWAGWSEGQDLDAFIR
jgi:hypothetical protein